MPIDITLFITKLQFFYHNILNIEHRELQDFFVTRAWIICNMYMQIFMKNHFKYPVLYKTVKILRYCPFSSHKLCDLINPYINNKWYQNI